MGLATIKLGGADIYATNKSGNDWAATKQVTTKPVKVFSVVANTRAAVGADRYIYFFDTAAGSASTVAAKFYVYAFQGTTTTLEFTNGSLFVNGLYIVVATDEVADANTAPTAGSANDSSVSIDIRVQ